MCICNTQSAKFARSYVRFECLAPGCLGAQGVPCKRKRRPNPAACTRSTRAVVCARERAWNSYDADSEHE